MKYRTYGLYLPQELITKLSKHFYNDAGVVDLEYYFDVQRGEVPDGDPGAESMNYLTEKMVSEFARLYDEADFKSVQEEYDYDEFHMIKLAGTGTIVHDLLEKFQSAVTIQECDKRIVHTAIMIVVLEKFNLKTDKRMC